MGYTPQTRVKKTDEYRDWLDRLRDQAGRARILVRVDRLIHGNPGSHRNLQGGVSELKIDFGPGYRVDYTQRGEQLLLLLIGGDKSSQTKDIAKAQQLAKDFEE
ncbi:MAG: type II toxin-antitoxin system RelE/ParE family toxin [Betaproteobacteria bacterium]